MQGLGHALPDSSVTTLSEESCETYEAEVSSLEGVKVACLCWLPPQGLAAGSGHFGQMTLLPGSPTLPGLAQGPRGSLVQAPAVTGSLVAFSPAHILR